MIGRMVVNWFGAIRADIAALRASRRSVRGGWREAWRDMGALARHRQIVVATSVGAQVVLLTRIRLSGEIETCVQRGWLKDSAAKDAPATVDAHFTAVAAATTGWPAAFGIVRLGSRIVGGSGWGTVVVQAIRALLSHGPAVLPRLILTNRPLLAGLGFALMALAGRPLLRWWLRTMIRRVPVRVPASS